MSSAAASTVEPSSPHVLDDSSQSVDRYSAQAGRLRRVRAVDSRLVAALLGANPSLSDSSSSGDSSGVDGVETFAQSLLETEALLAAFPPEYAAASRDLIAERREAWAPLVEQMPWFKSSAESDGSSVGSAGEGKMWLQRLAAPREVRHCVALLDQKDKVQDDLEALLCSLDPSLRREDLAYMRALDCDVRVNDEALQQLPPEYHGLQELARVKHQLDDDLLATGYFGVPRAAAFSDGVAVATTGAANSGGDAPIADLSPQRSFSLQGASGLLSTVTRRFSGADGPLLEAADGIDVDWRWWGLTVDVSHQRYLQLLQVEDGSSILSGALSSVATGPYAALAALLAAATKLHSSVLRRIEAGNGVRFNVPWQALYPLPTPLWVVPAPL